MVFDFRHYCPGCGILVGLPTAIVAGRWYCGDCRPLADGEHDTRPLHEVVLDCPGCGRYHVCKRWIDNVLGS